MADYIVGASNEREIEEIFFANDNLNESEMKDGGSGSSSLPAGGGGGVGGELVVRKQRGRPAGSKNKPKPPVIITKESEACMHTYVMEVAAGSDVVKSLMIFSRRHHKCLTILNAYGSVTNLVLRHTTAHPSSLRGRFNILTLSGSFFPEINYPTVVPDVTISLAGLQGQIIGGILVGPLVAATRVVLMVAVCVTPSYHKLPTIDPEEEELVMTPQQAAAGGQTSTTPLLLSGVYNGGPVSFNTPTEVMQWSHPPPY